MDYYYYYYYYHHHQHHHYYFTMWEDNFLLPFCWNALLSPLFCRRAQSSFTHPLPMEERLKQFMFQGTSTCESENRTKKKLAAHGDCSSIAS
jgi:hypothetical protein